jgi:hypothetical protein
MLSGSIPRSREWNSLSPGLVQQSTKTSHAEQRQEKQMKARHSFRATVFCGLIALIAAPVVSADAAHPVKGKTYSGSIKRLAGANTTLPITFEVSSNGKKVQDFSLPSGYPVYCEGGGFGETQDVTAKISSKGTFTAKLPIYFAPTHDHQGFVKITGKFGKKGNESGTAITEFSSFKTCNGTSKYTAKAG